MTIYEIIKAAISVKQAAKHYRDTRDYGREKALSSHRLYVAECALRGKFSNSGKVYISGPMAGFPNYNREAFFEAEKRLEECGFSVVNPARVELSEGASWEDYMKADIKALVDCCGLVTLPGWVFSKGASIEVDVARNLGLWVRDFKDIFEGSEVDHG